MRYQSVESYREWNSIAISSERKGSYGNNNRKRPCRVQEMLCLSLMMSASRLVNLYWLLQ